jgi:ABC-type nitrate/sulfonate/bicarbonate transport system ATPase subunit
MASICKQKAGTWRVQIRRKGRSLSENFVRHEDAKRWAVDAERQIDRGQTPTPSRVGRLKTFGDLIDLHISDMADVGKAPGRSKTATLRMLKQQLGALNVVEIDRERIVRFGRARAKAGAGPVTLSMDVGLVKLVVQHAAAVHGLPVQVEPIDLGRIALKRLGLIGKSNERDRRPTEDELEALFHLWDSNERLLIPMSRIVKYAIATAMRQEEICRVEWSDHNARTKMLLIRDRKDPRQKKGPNRGVILIFGESGCGKSTIAKLLCGEAEPRRGVVEVNGFPPSAITSGIAAVLQTDRLITGTVRENISLSRTAVGDDQILSALDLVQFSEFVLGLPLGLETIVGEEIPGLSAGQRQRLLLARAIAVPPKLLILDEATSALDLESERSILQRLIGLGCTTIIISHRFEARDLPDRVYEMKAGRLRLAHD